MRRAGARGGAKLFVGDPTLTFSPIIEVAVKSCCGAGLC